MATALATSKADEKDPLSSGTALNRMAPRLVETGRYRLPEAFGRFVTDDLKALTTPGRLPGSATALD
jgi:hypothetical protein